MNASTSYFEATVLLRSGTLSRAPENAQPGFAGFYLQNIQVMIKQTGTPKKTLGIKVNILKLLILGNY